MYQKHIIVGNLGRDPEMRYTPNGKAVCNFSVAVNNRWTGGDGEKHEETTWFRIAAWGRLAEVCNEYLSKGRQVLVEGRLVTNQATGGPRVYQKNDGSYGAAFELTASTVQFLGSGGGGEAAGSEESEPEEEQIPF